jgi:hypothetical protein
MAIKGWMREAAEAAEAGDDSVGQRREPRLQSKEEA